MNIAMFTNLYLPLVGGIQRSIATFKREFNQRGHEVLVVTPETEEPPPDESGVVQVPAIQDFSGSDFPVAVPVPGYLAKTLDDFAPDVVHSHHPFFLGDTALRAATKRECPLVFTYHTMWEHYLHYVPSDAPAMARFVKRMAVEYCNLCDHVITPCESVAEIIRERGVVSPITAIPTGIDADRFREGDGSAARERLGIDQDAFIAGYIGRLGPEKNIDFLAQALLRVCAAREDAHALFVGHGEAAEQAKQIFRDANQSDRLHMPGVLEGQELIDAYHALDVFPFASCSETQGLVLAEAMAAGRPVIALDAPGARDIIRDGENGRLLDEHDPQQFADIVLEFASHDAHRREQLEREAQATAAKMSSGNCAERALALYEQVLEQRVKDRSAEENAWRNTLRRIEAEWALWSGRAAAVGDAFSRKSEPGKST